MGADHQGISADAVLAELGGIREAMGKLAGAYDALAEQERECRKSFRATLYGPDGASGLVKTVEGLTQSDNRRRRIEAWIGRAVLGLLVPVVLYVGGKAWEVLKKVF